ncbi:MAG TPA: hypothetical protein VGP46_11055 [Acidimicrobiales bacterium]|nr:hypothetical protein [Acidimicrobiales bacterium]
MDHELGNPEWLGTARAFVTNLGAHATADTLRLLAPDVSYRVLGHHALSGTFSGREAVAAHLEAIINQTDGRLDPVKFDDWMLGLSHVSVLVDILVEVGAASQRLRHLILMRFNADDLIDELTVFFSDPASADRLYGHLLRDASNKPES